MISKRQLLKYRGTYCLNCHQPLDTSECYCHYCGQLNSTKKLTFDDFFNEFFAGIFAYDSRLYRTLNALLFKPGKISKDYIEGKRQRYANPYRFYLSASIIFFILYGYTSSFNIQSDETVSPAIAEETKAKVDDPALASNDVVPVEVRKFPFIGAEKKLAEIYVPAATLDTLGFWNETATKFNIFLKKYETSEIKVAEKALQSMDYPVTRYNLWLYEKVVDFSFISSNPDIFFRYLISKLPFIIFFFLPLFALFIWLLYAKKQHTYMEHLIFSFHSQTMWFVLLSIAILIDYSFEINTAKKAANLLFLFYLYKAMRKFYMQRRLKTFVKFILLNTIFITLAIIAVIFSVIASFAIY